MPPLNQVALLVFFAIIVIVLGFVLYKYKLIRRLKDYIGYHLVLRRFKQRMPGILKHFHAIEAFDLSTRYREQHQLEESHFTYGEIDLLALMGLLYDLKPTKDDQFYDLGCGLGFTVLMAGACFDLKKAVGVEFLTPLYEVADKNLKAIQAATPEMTTIEFIHGNFLDVDLDDANIIFINSTAMTGEFWPKVEQKIQTLNSGTRIILTSHRLSEAHFELLDEMMQPMNWGLASTFVYQKR